MADSEGWQGQAERVRLALRSQLGEALVGVYIHGSAAMGGWTPTSDLDILVTTDSAEGDFSDVASHVMATLAPSPVVELSVVNCDAAAIAQPPWPFLVHIDQASDRVICDDGSGDSDLLMHYVVTRHSGITLEGPPAETAFGNVPRPAVLAYLREELVWALENADPKYAVLNACRALAYEVTGAVLSKVDGAYWALSRGLDDDLVRSALVAQQEGVTLGSPGPVARQFVTDCIEPLAQA